MALFGTTLATGDASVPVLPSSVSMERLGLKGMGLVNLLTRSWGHRGNLTH